MAEMSLLTSRPSDDAADAKQQQQPPATDEEEDEEEGSADHESDNDSNEEEEEGNDDDEGNDDADADESVSSRVVSRVLSLVTRAGEYRPVTVQMALLLLREVLARQRYGLTAAQRDRFMEAYGNAIAAVKACLGSSLADIFLELFEQTGAALRDVAFDSLLLDGALVLPVAASPVSHLRLPQRLPSGEAERTQKAVHQLFVLRRFYFGEIARAPDTLLPLQAMPLPPYTRSSYFSFRPATVYASFICPVSAKKSVLRYFVVDAGALLILDPPPSTPLAASTPPSPLRRTTTTAFGHGGTSTSSSPLALSARSSSSSSSSSTAAQQSSHPTTAVVSEIVPLESIEVETEADYIQVTSHPLRWSVRMQFVSKKMLLAAERTLDAGRRRARQFKMKQIYKALGIDVDDMLLAAPPRCAAARTDASETSTGSVSVVPDSAAADSAAAAPLLSSTPSLQHPLSPPEGRRLSSQDFAEDGDADGAVPHHRAPPPPLVRESSQDELVKASEALFESDAPTTPAL